LFSKDIRLSNIEILAKAGQRKKIKGGKRSGKKQRAAVIAPLLPEHQLWLAIRG
jgi:hypothetical protein